MYYCYVFKMVDTGLIGKSENPILFKIGHTTDISRRLATIQSNSPFKITYYDSIESKDKDLILSVERRLQEFCYYSRYKGEWFKYDEHCFENNFMPYFEKVAENNPNLRITDE